MSTDLAHDFDLLLDNVRELLTSSDPRSRVRAVRHLAFGAHILERQALIDAQGEGLSWADIGSLYGVTRQAAHRRFTTETVVPSEAFDELLDALDNEDGPLPHALVQASKRLRHSRAL